MAYETNFRHRRMEIRPVGADGSAVFTGALTTGPALIMALAIDYQNQPATADLLIKADNVNGATLFTRSNSATDVAQIAVAIPALDEAGGALAATDIGAGGVPVRGGLWFDLAQGDGQTSGDELIFVDVWFKKIQYIKRTLNPVGGAGTSVATDTVRLGRAGNLAAYAVDYTNQAATGDIVIKSDDTNGVTLLTRANNATDITPQCFGAPGADETFAATASTDSHGGAVGCFKTGLFIDLAQFDDSADGAKSVVVELWCD
jgi:hypothetical protein